MKLGKAVIYYYDTDSDDSPINALKSTLDSRDWISYDIFDCEEVEIGSWHDDIPINKIGAKQADYDIYFDVDRKVIIEMAQAVSNIMKTAKYTGIDITKAKAMVLEEFKLNQNIITNSKFVKLFEEQCIIEMTFR